jgi:hypothetical protein
MDTVRVNTYSGIQKMKIKLNLMTFFVFITVFLMIQSLSVFAELIEPSRTLEGQQKTMGRLSVFSEPPALNVLLDGVKIGKTPVLSKEVTSGVHILRVKDDGLVKSRKCAFIVIPAPHQVRDKLWRESSDFRWFWMPAYAGMTGFGTFYECVKDTEKKLRSYREKPFN